MNIGFKEDLTIEFKSDKNKLPDSDLVDAVVAFANTNGGDIYLGIEDDGEITGLHKSHQDITQLAAFIANKTVPPIAVRAEKSEDKQELEKLLSWLEYETFCLPKPDIEIVSTAPDEHYSRGHHLVRSEDVTRSYVTDKDADIHEKDSSLQLNVNSYFRNLLSSSNRVLINAYNEDGNRLKVEQVHEQIVGFVDQILGNGS